MGETPAVSWIDGALTNLWNVFTSALNTLTSNTFFAIILVSAVVVIAFKLIKKAKKAAR